MSEQTLARTVLQAALALIGGSLIGGGLSIWALDPVAEEPDDGVSCQAALEQARRDLTAVGEQIQALEPAIAKARALRIARLGRQIAMPNNTPEHLRETGLRTHLDHVLDGTEATVEHLDCTAYPCVAVLRWQVPDEERDVVDDGAGGALLSGSLAAHLHQGAYEGLTLVDTGELADDDGTETLHSIAFLSAQDLKTAKQTPPEVAERDGTLVEQVKGRAASVLDEWVAERVDAGEAP